MTAFYILAALSVGACAGFVFCGVLLANKFADLEDLLAAERQHSALLSRANQILGDNLTPFDRDGDGRPGGSLKKPLTAFQEGGR